MGDFEPKETLYRASVVGLYSGLAGTFVSTLQNALGTHNHGAFGVITRTGGTIGFFAAMGATFAFTESFVANQRKTDDYVNTASGACAAGFLAGIRARSLPAAFGSCAFLSGLVGAYEFSGGLRGEGPPNEEKRLSFFKPQSHPLVKSVHPPTPQPGSSH